MGDRRRRPGKELASEYTSSGDPRDGNLGNDTPIVITDNQGRMLVIDSNKIPDTPLWKANCNGRHCTAISKRSNEAYHMYNTLLQCQHPNMLQPIGVWMDPADSSKAYIVVNLLDNALSSVAVEQLFHKEKTYLNGFTEFGIEVFKEIFSAIHYVNTKYKGGGGTSSSTSSDQIELLPMMLEPRNIFLRTTRGFSSQVFVGNFKLKLSDEYIRRTNKRCIIESTREDFVAAHWKEIARTISTLSGDQINAHGNEELKQLVALLSEGNVRYDELLWQPALWDAYTKMHFIREIFWLLDEQRDQSDFHSDGFAKTARGKKLMKEKPLGLLSIMLLFTPPMDKTRRPLPIKDDHMLDSLTFLRHKIVAHYDEEYLQFKGDQREIGTSKFSVEKYIQRNRPDYMINLVKAIRKLGWIKESPAMRSATYYMKTFGEMKLQLKE
ncbi:hypothetical protein QOZ80_5BG0455630 [Eleusine coracana subsp. coracana]|nr:hypothetical protein QOZ80_5BG0455630 [Eleusine coracana subsp. coracana]